jgi:hypothetical protein
MNPFCLSHFEGEGLLVTPVDQNRRPLPAFRHTVVLTGLHADTPARTKISGTMASAMAYLPCQWCWFAGSQFREELGTTAMLFRGYCTPRVMKAGVLKDKHIQLHHPAYDPPERLLTAAQQMERAEAAFARIGQKDVGRMFGCIQPCLVMKILPYTDYNNFFLLPLGHSLFLGVVKDFVKLVTGELGDGDLEKPFLISKDGLKAIAQAEKHLILTSDFGRPYISIINKQGRYVMEDWARFLEVFSVYLFSDKAMGLTILPPLAKKAWGHLRRFALYHMRHSYARDKETRDAATADLLEYAKVLDEVKFI